MRHLIRAVGLLTTAALTLPITQTAGMTRQSLKVETFAFTQIKQTSGSDGFSQGRLEGSDQVVTNTQRRFDAYGFDGEAGETIRMTVTSEAFVPVIVLVDETTGEGIERETGEAGTATLTHELLRDGAYTFLVSATDVPGEGSYEFKIVTIREVPRAETEADRLFQQGVQQYESGQIEAAIASLEQALQLYEEQGNTDVRRAVLSNLAVARLNLYNEHLNANEYQQMIEVGEPLLDIVIEFGDRAGENSILTGLGVAYQGTGTKLWR